MITDKLPLTPPDDEPEWQCPHCGDWYAVSRFLMRHRCPSCLHEILVGWGDLERTWDDDEVDG